MEKLCTSGDPSFFSLSTFSVTLSAPFIVRRGSEKDSFYFNKVYFVLSTSLNRDAETLWRSELKVGESAGFDFDGATVTLSITCAEL